MFSYFSWYVCTKVENFFFFGTVEIGSQPRFRKMIMYKCVGRYSKIIALTPPLSFEITMRDTVETYPKKLQRNCATESVSKKRN